MGREESRAGIEPGMVALKRGQEEEKRETDLPAAQPAAAARARIPASHAYQLGPQGTGPQAGQVEIASDRLRLGLRRRMPWGDEPLKSREAIDRLFQEGAKFHGRNLLLVARRTPGPRRVLFVASRRVGNAVRRNRAKRVMRASWQGIAKRLTEVEWHLGWIARPSCAEQDMRTIEREMEDLLRRAGLSAVAAGRRGSPDPQDHRT